MGIEIVEVDTRSASETLLREMHEVEVVLEAELLPEDPPVPFEQRLSEWRHIPDHLMVPRWALREHGDVVATALAHMYTDEDLDNGFVHGGVVPGRRRAGLAMKLATPVLARLADEGRKSLIVETIEDAPWEGWLQGLGLDRSLSERRSRLTVADIDWSLMESWIESASSRSEGYDLLFLETPIPEEHLENWAEVQHVMNTAPTEELDFEFPVWTPGRWREHERALMLRGDHLLGYVAVDRHTGNFVGLSNIEAQQSQRHVAWQGDTGVHPDHRGNGLGRWLKAATIMRFAKDHPGIPHVDTYTAGSNEPMVRINEEMGYRPILHLSAWQGDLTVARDRLSAP